MEVVIKKKVEVHTFDELKNGETFFAPQRTEGEQELLMAINTFADYTAVNLHNGELIDMEAEDVIIPVNNAKITVE